MNREWSLDVLYKGYDDPKFDADQKELDELLKEFTKQMEDLHRDPKEFLKESLLLQQQITAKAHDLFSFAQLQQSVNTSDSVSTAVIGILANKLSLMAVPSTALTQYIAGLEDLDALIESDPDRKSTRLNLNSI